MPAPRTLQQLSDDIVGMAIQVIGMSQQLKNREVAEFLRGTPRQRAVVAEGLALTEDQVQALIMADAESAAPGAPGTPATKRHLWDYDTKTATVEDLTRRRDLLRERLRVLSYLRAH